MGISERRNKNNKIRKKYWLWVKVYVSDTIFFYIPKKIYKYK